MVITKAQKFWLESDFVFELLKQIPAYIFWKDINSVYLGCNNAFANSMELSPAEIVGKTDYDLSTTKEESDIFRADDKQVIESKRPKLNIEESQTLPNGQKITLLTNKVPLFDKQKNVIGILGIYYDITERKKKEDELKTAKESAELANQLKHDFIQNMEHDIRTPVAGIYSILQSFSDSETDPEKKEILTLTFNAAKELLDYCNGILDFSKLESGLIPIISKKFNLKKLMDGIISIETPPAKIKNLQLTAEFSENVPNIIVGDQQRLQRILINLISNGIKFTKEGFIKVTTTVAKKEDKNIILQISVEDSGIGMPKEKQSIIYEKFSRLHASNRGTYKGSGLGLPTVKQLVEELDGEIDVESIPGEGTTFLLTIPFKLPLLDEFFWDNVEMNND
jgi:two-component system aerobic respiration control sensor histidine kinase ArcB